MKSKGGKMKISNISTKTTRNGKTLHQFVGIEPYRVKGKRKEQKWLCVYYSDIGQVLYNDDWIKYTEFQIDQNKYKGQDFRWKTTYQVVIWKCEKLENVDELGRKIRGKKKAIEPSKDSVDTIVEKDTKTRTTKPNKAKKAVEIDFEEDEFV